MAEASTATRNITLSKIRIDGDTQVRVELNQFVIDTYAEDMKRGDPFPPITLFSERSSFWLGDGWHRVEAAYEAGRNTIEAEVRKGGRRDALLYACGSNARHGLRRTNQDKRNAVEILLTDKKWARWSDRRIAQHCAVSHNFVSTLRRDLSVNGLQMDERMAWRNGTSYTINTANIGASQRISKSVRDLIRDTPFAESRDEIAQLAELHADQQERVALKVLSGEAETVIDALWQVKREEKRGAVDRENIVLPPLPVHLAVADARHMPLPDESIDMVITSPPLVIAGLWNGAADLGWKEKM